MTSDRTTGFRNSIKWSGHKLLLLALVLPISISPLVEVSVTRAEEYSPELVELLPGATMTLFAEHPQVMTPTGIDVDTHGRVWVIACHTHFRPDPYDGPEHDEVVVLTPSKTIGQPPHRSVFYNRTKATMDLELGPDGWVYLAERGRIVRVRDSTGDGKGDEEQVLATLHTEADYPHNGLAGISWHPSGDLMFSLGENHWKDWQLESADASRLRGTGEGGIFRCGPSGENLRRVARGFWNPFGICVRPDGELFAADNDPGSRPPCRLLHIVDGGDYGYQRLYGESPQHPFVAWNGELRGTLPMIAPTGEAPCGIAPLGQGVLVPSWADHRIDFFPLTPKGSSFTSTRHELVTGSEYFRPTCIAQVSATVFYLSDWVVGTYEVHQRGRIWRLEIDPVAARDWVGDFEPQPAMQQRKLAESLRSGDSTLAYPELLALARQDDAFLARASMQAMARTLTADGRLPDFSDWDEADRCSLCLAARLAKPKHADWATFFLNDEALTVRFEALRWIADERLPGFDDAIHAILSEPDLPFSTFAAAVAAWNTVHDYARKGISDPAMLLDRIFDESASDAVRSYALRLLPRGHKALSQARLESMLERPSLELKLEVVRYFGESESASTQDLLCKIALDDTWVEQIRAEAILGMSRSASRHRGSLIVLASDRNRAVRHEALRALRNETLDPQERIALEQIATAFPDSSDLVLAITSPQVLIEGRSGRESTADWLAALDADQPADPEAGRRIFFHPKVAQCAVCHLHDGRGRVVGPDLSLIAQQSNRSKLIESILDPNRDVAPQYFRWALELDSGNIFTGIMLRKGGRNNIETYRDAGGHEQSFRKDQIVSRQEMKTSLMPEGLLMTLTDQEIRDLLAFLGN